MRISIADKSFIFYSGVTFVFLILLQMMKISMAWMLVSASTGSALSLGDGKITVADLGQVFLMLPSQQFRNSNIFCGSLCQYPGYSGPAKITGEAGLTFDADSVGIAFQLGGLEKECEKPNNQVFLFLSSPFPSYLSVCILHLQTPNSCGIHIHEGKSCADASSPGMRVCFPKIRPLTFNNVWFSFLSAHQKGAIISTVQPTLKIPGLPWHIFQLVIMPLAALALGKKHIFCD